MKRVSEIRYPTVCVHLLPSLIPPAALKGGVAIAVDVLRATTTMVYALEAGFESIVPCLEIEEAQAVAARFPAGSAFLAGERKGLPIPGFDLGNSPGDMRKADRTGKTLVMTTTNGTRAILASLEARHVGIAALVNAKRTVEWAASWNLPVHVVCAGTDGLISLEDSLLAGLMADELARFWEFSLGNDQAEIARALYIDSRRMEREEFIPRPVQLARGRGGRRVLEIGLGADIEAVCAEEPGLEAIVGELQRDPLRIVRWHGPAPSDPE